MKDGDGLFLLLLGVLGLMFLVKNGGQPQSGVSVKAVALKPQTITNEETWEWRDWQGNSRKITVHRNVKVDG